MSPSWTFDGQLPTIDPGTRDGPLTADESLYLGEDLWSARWSDGVIIDVGWYPEGDPAGEFWCRVILDEDWSRPRRELRTRSLAQVEDWILRARYATDHGHTSTLPVSGSIPAHYDVPNSRALLVYLVLCSIVICVFDRAYVRMFLPSLFCIFMIFIFARWILQILKGYLGGRDVRRRRGEGGISPLGVDGTGHNVPTSKLKQEIRKSK